MELHKNQVKLLEFLAEENTDGMSLWDIARETGLKNAQTVSHHIKQLEKYGYLRRALDNPSQLEVLKHPIEDIAYITVYGYAQCGNVSDFISEDNTKDRLAISTKLFGISNLKNIFAIRAKGDSMSPYISDKDFVLVEKAESVNSSDIALVVDDGIPKVKKVIKKDNRNFVLSSINSLKYPDKDVKYSSDFFILGRAIAVIRGLNNPPSQSS